MRHQSAAAAWSSGSGPSADGLARAGRWTSMPALETRAMRVARVGTKSSVRRCGSRCAEERSPFVEGGGAEVGDSVGRGAAASGRAAAVLAVRRWDADRCRARCWLLARPRRRRRARWADAAPSAAQEGGSWRVAAAWSDGLGEAAGCVRRGRSGRRPRPGGGRAWSGSGSARGVARAGGLVVGVVEAPGEDGGGVASGGDGVGGDAGERGDGVAVVGGDGEQLGEQGGPGVGLGDAGQEPVDGALEVRRSASVVMWSAANTIASR